MLSSSSSIPCVFWAARRRRATASTRLALLEVVPSAAPAARRHLARSRAVMGDLNAWAGTWAGKDDDPQGSSLPCERPVKVPPRC